MVKDGGWRETFYGRLLKTFYIVNHVQNLVSVQEKEMNTVQYSEYNIKGRKFEGKLRNSTHFTKSL